METAPAKNIASLKTFGAVLAALTLVCGPATAQRQQPKPAVQGDAGSTASYSLVFDKNNPYNKVKGTLPPFVSGALQVSLIIEIDAGQIAQEMGGAIKLVRAQMVGTDYFFCNSFATLDGKPVRIDSTSARFNRPFFITKATEASGRLQIHASGVLLLRSVEAGD